MGQGFSFKCPSCGEKFDYHFGGGMILPREEYLQDEEGFAEAKQFVTEHPNGLVDCGLVVKKCSQCGNLTNVRDFSFWLPKDENETPEYGNYFYADPEKYEKSRNAPFVCKRCGSEKYETLTMDDFLDLTANA